MDFANWYRELIELLGFKMDSRGRVPGFNGEWAVVEETDNGFACEWEWYPAPFGPQCDVDPTLQGYAKVYNDVGSMVTSGVYAAIAREYQLRGPKQLGRDDIKSWPEVIRAFREPWQEGIETVNDMRLEIEQAVQEPKSKKRKGRWSEDSFRGEIDVDRAMAGVGDPFRETVRLDRTGSRTVVILCNMGGAYALDPKDMFWKGAVATALVDLLESAGYSCEVWAWHLSDQCYEGEMHRSFDAAKIKDAGQSVDIDQMAKTLSTWFFRSVVFGSEHLPLDAKIRWVPQVRANGEEFKTRGYSNKNLGEWRKYMDCTEGVQEIMIPSVYNREAAIDAVKTIIDELQGDER